jgi:hypothetical protein
MSHTYHTHPVQFRSSEQPTHIPNIRCAVCDRYVERIEWFDDLVKRDRIIRVFCHGESDEMRLDVYRLSLDELRTIGDSEGVAFTTKRIEA